MLTTLLPLCRERGWLKVTWSGENITYSKLLPLCRERGWLKERGKQRTDSPHVVAAIRTMNRLECAGETLRAALNRLAQVVPDWVRAQVPPEWYERSATRMEDFRIPKEASRRQALAEPIGQDGSWLLSAVRARSGSPLAARHPGG